MNKGLVSIIMPARNAAQWLPETLASVQAQTYPDWELIFVDDGSTDDTAARVQTAATNDDRIHYYSIISNEAGCVARARNLGMEKSTGEFIALLDADDLWEPDKLSVQVRYLTEHPEADGVCCWFDVFGDPARVRQTRFRRRTAMVVTTDEVTSGNPFHTCTVMIRRNCWEETGGYDTDSRLRRLHEDYEFHARLVKRYCIHRIHQTLAHYRLTPPQAESLTSSTQADFTTHSRDLLAIFREKGLLTERQLRERESFLVFEEVRMNVLIHCRPFRKILVHLILNYRPVPWQAWVFIVLSPLPTKLIRRIILWMQR